MEIFPNPFNSATTIRYRLEDSSRISLTVTDLTGRVVAVPLPESEQEAGVYDVRFDGSDLGPGVYSVHLHFAEGSVNGRMVVIR